MMPQGIFRLIGGTEGDQVPTEFQILPDGKIEIEGETPAYLDAEAAKSVIENFERRGKDMVIDYEHQTLKDVQAPAAGWITRLIYKGRDGLWATVAWTERARQYLASREYRYFSPVMWLDKARKVKSIANVALTNSPLMNNLRPIVAKMSLEEAREEREARSKKYGIAIKEGGHLTKSGEWESVADDEFLDPVNYRYPCPDADQTRAAAAYWGRPDNQAQYSGEERSIINDRLAERKKKFGIGEEAEKKEAKMIDQIKKLLNLAGDATEEVICKAVEGLIARLAVLKEILGALGAKEDAGQEEVLQVVAKLKAPGDVAVQLSQQVAELTRELSQIKQNDLIQLALKEGKTSPEELDRWGRSLALKDPEQFRVIVLSRPAGSVIPVGGIAPSPPPRDAALGDAQKQINRMMGISEEVWKKYNPTA